MKEAENLIVAGNENCTMLEETIAKAKEALQVSIKLRGVNYFTRLNII
jgi:hypothetical protein